MGAWGQGGGVDPTPPRGFFQGNTGPQAKPWTTSRPWTVPGSHKDVTDSQGDNKVRTVGPNNPPHSPATTDLLFQDSVAPEGNHLSQPLGCKKRVQTRSTGHMPHLPPQSQRPHPPGRHEETCFPDCSLCLARKVEPLRSSF